MTTTIENKIAKSAEEQKLPALTGSVKQIAWATDIRAKKLARLDDRIAKIQSNVSDDAQHRKNQIAYQAARNVLFTKVESRFWIDNRFVDGTKLLAANNLQDAFKAEFERLCNEAGIKAEVKAEKKPAEVKAEVKAEEKPAEVKAEVKVETDDTKMTTTTTNDATKLYKVFAINQDFGIHECKSKLNIIVGESRISAFMNVDCKTLKSACCNFHKALEQAVTDGVLDAKIPQFGKFADTDAIDFGAEDSVTFSGVNDNYAYGIDDFSDYDRGYYFWFWVKIDAISAEVKAKVKAEAKAEAKAEVKAEVKAETDGSEDDPDDQKDVYKLLPAIDTLNDVDTTHETMTVAQVKIAQPQDNFTAELAKLKAAADEAHAEYRKARGRIADDRKARGLTAAIIAYQNFGTDKADAMRDGLLTDDIIRAIRAKGITIINQQGEVTKETISQIWIIFREDKFKISTSWDKYGTYDTPAQVETVINMLKAAIERGDEEFTFPTIDQLNTPPKMPPCAPKSPDITQANNEHKPEKSVSEPLEYWVGSWYGNFAAPKKLIHPRGKKFYYVAWDYYDTCCREYWLTYTRNADEDKILFDEHQHGWIKIPRGAAIDLVKRGGHKCPAISNFVRQGGQYTRLSEPPFWAKNRMSKWLEYKYRPILPYVIDIDSAEIFAGKVWINKRSHTVEEC